MVRAYEPEPIPRETIERIVGTIRRAPSAGFSQGQRLVVVTDAGTRKRIADILEESSPAPRSGATLELWLNAPVLIVVGVREDDYHERYRKQDKLTDGAEIEWPIPYWHFDAGAAAMLILLTAIDEGYAAGLFGVFAGATPSFKELLGIPDDVAVACVVPMGKPVKQLTTLKRAEVADLARLETWTGGPLT